MWPSELSNKQQKRQLTRVKSKIQSKLFIDKNLISFPFHFRDKMLCNAAYCYLKMGQPLEAVNIFNKVTEATFRSTIGLAYANYRAKQYENSYTVYESALEYLAKNDQEKALILVALASMVYAFQGDSDAKSVLYQWYLHINLINSQAVIIGCLLSVLVFRIHRSKRCCHHVHSEYYILISS